MKQVINTWTHQLGQCVKYGNLIDTETGNEEFFSMISVPHGDIRCYFFATSQEAKDNAKELYKLI